MGFSCLPCKINEWISIYDTDVANTMVIKTWFWLTAALANRKTAHALCPLHTINCVVTCNLMIKTWIPPFINLSFTGNSPWRIFRSTSQVKSYNFLKPRKISTQHLNLLLPSNRPKHGLHIIHRSVTLFIHIKWNTTEWYTFSIKAPVRVQ